MAFATCVCWLPWMATCCGCLPRPANAETCRLGAWQMHVFSRALLPIVFDRHHPCSDIRFHSACITGTSPVWRQCLVGVVQNAYLLIFIYLSRSATDRKSTRLNSS